MRSLPAFISVVVVASAVLVGCAQGADTETVATMTAGPVVTATATETSSAVASPTAVLSATTVPTSTPAATATVAPIATLSATATPLPEVVPTSSPAATATVVQAATPTPATGGHDDALADPDDHDDSEPEDLPPSGYTGQVRAIRTPRGLVLPVRAATADGYVVVTPCYNLATVSSGLAIGGPLDVLIDPGHGGQETGAVGPNGLKESTVNLRVAELLRAELIQRGYTVELTRYSDERIAIQSRAELANALRPRVFMSIHHNGGYPEPFPVAGTEVFVQVDDPESARLGGLVFEEIQEAFADVEADWMGTPDTFGVAWRKNDEGTDLYGVLRRTPDLVSVLTEAMYISTEAEAELLAHPEILEREALALAAALDRWFDTDDAGSGFVDGVEFQGDLGNGGGTHGCVDPPLS